MNTLPDHFEILQFRQDGWPLCPVCEQDELFSPIWGELTPCPPIAEFIAGPLQCLVCGWRKEAVELPPLKATIIQTKERSIKRKNT
jgi:hypothetical protein